MREHIKFIIYSLIFAFFILPFTNAAQDTQCVNTSLTDISPSSIGIGKDFTVGFQIENCGPKIPEIVSFELLNPPTDIFIKEPLQINISKLSYANSQRFIIYHMRTSNDAYPGTHVIKTRVTYGDNGYFSIQESNITFDVIGNKAELNIASMKTKPVLPIEGDIVELTLRIENVAEGTAKSIKVYADYPFEGVKQSFIGALKQNEDGPAIFTFIPNKAGEFEFPVTIVYTDDFGEKEIKTNLKLSILNKKSNLLGIILGIIIVIIFGATIFYFIKRDKSKDLIIQGFLKSNGNNSKEKGKSKEKKK